MGIVVALTSRRLTALTNTVYLVHMHHARVKALKVITVLCTETQLADMI